MCKIKRIISGIIVSTMIISMIACYSPEITTSIPKEIEETEENEEKEKLVGDFTKSVLTEENIQDNMLLYENDDDYSVITMYLTVNSGNEADECNHTWQEINTYSAYDYKDMGVDRYKVEGILQIDESGEGLSEDSYGYNEVVPNVSVQVRGQTSSRSDEKNYKIKIKEDKDPFRGQRTLNLNKHYVDPYRFINKMCYDMLDGVPQLMSARTQFVHLYVKDLTNINGAETTYTDYGLYTMVEQVNKTYLIKRKLDEKGQLYKVTFFEWDEYDAVMMDPNDPEFDRESFEKYLEIKGDEDPTKLQEIVRDIHNYNIPIEEIITEHFDEENLCYWMAFNILIGNNDVGARNLFLYSPLNSERFYFICWDMDASFKLSYNRRKGETDGVSWESGMTKFLGLTLVRRMMKEEKYRNMLSAAVEDLYANHVNGEIVEERVSKYKEITLQYLYKEPRIDIARLPDLQTYNELTALIPSEVDDNYQMFLDSMKKPWPFYVDLPEYTEGKDKLQLSWGVSYDVNSEEVTYNFVLARDFFFGDVIYENYDSYVPVYTIDDPGPGTYYLKVYSTNQSGYSMDCFDYFATDEYGKIYGCFGFKINEDGTISYYEREESLDGDV